MPNSKRKSQFEDPAETAKRLEQNKNYQKGFRERRKEKLRQLEEKVALLEAEIEILRNSAPPQEPPTVVESFTVPTRVVPFTGFVTETADLRYRMVQLEAENAALKLKMEERVTFDIPLAFRNIESPIMPAVETTTDLQSTKHDQKLTSSEASTNNIIDDTWWSEMIAFSDDEEEGGVADPNQTAPPPFNAEAIKKELASIPALSHSQDLIADFCNLFVNPQTRISTFLHDNAEKKLALLNQCSSEAERIEVMDALDRGRTENLEYIQYLHELVLSNAPKVSGVTLPPTHVSNAYIACIRELPRKVSVLQNERGKKLVEALEHNHR
ncbi:UNVERIFIED_CONTAM: hypothetical protein HDU68_009717, partial [Siphonaria sp. JEL0065]